MRTFFVPIMAGLVSALIATAPTQAAMIINGDFDTAVPQSGTGGGWTPAGNDATGGWKSSGGNPGSYFRLNSGGADSDDPTLSQELTDLVIGQPYDITGDYLLQRNLGAPEDSFEVRIDGVAILTSGPGAASGVWSPFATDFIATSANQTLTLAAETNGSDHDYGVDNIRIDGADSPTVIPTPTALSGGLALLGWIAMRRQGRTRPRST